MHALISILLSSVFLGCTQPTRKDIKYTQQEQEQMIAKKADQIKNSYQKLVDSNYSKEAQQDYFDAFPYSFNSFMALFGCSDDFAKCGPLDYLDYFDAFFYKLLSIDKEIYLSKGVNIFIKGYWQSDAVGVFQDKMQAKFKQSFILFYSILKTHSEKEIKSFWHFYFSGPAPGHPEKVKDYNQIVKELNTIDKDMVPIVKEAYATEKEYWEKP